MKILLIGATGPTGQEIVKQGLAQGHEVTALVSDPSKMTAGLPKLHVVAGNILNQADVDAAMAGQDAVVCSLGTGLTFKHVTLFSEGTRTLLNAMNKNSVRRIVCITGIGAGDSRGHGGFFYDHVVTAFMRTRTGRKKSCGKATGIGSSSGQAC